MRYKTKWHGVRKTIKKRSRGKRMHKVSDKKKYGE